MRGWSFTAENHHAPQSRTINTFMMLIRQSTLLILLFFQLGGGCHLIGQPTSAGLPWIPPGETTSPGAVFSGSSGNVTSGKVRPDANFLASREDDGQWRQEIDFVLYLMGRGDLDESIFLLERLMPPPPPHADSLHYLLGWAHYRKMALEHSAGFLLRVSEDSPLYHKARFFGAYNKAHLGRTGEAISILAGVQTTAGGLNEAIWHLQMGGMALLSDDHLSYQQHAGHFRGQFHATAAEERRMEQHFLALSDNPPKSPFLGGVLSTAIPGLGRVYAGKSAEGIISFLYVTALGFTTYDFYRGGGSSNPLFILSASVTGIFYLGNIVGSVTAVRRANNEFRYEMDQRILFDMHIPLRNAFIR